MSSWLGSTSNKVKMPGVVYSEDYVPDYRDKHIGSFFTNLNLDSVKAQTLNIASANKVASVEEVPYTFFERAGLVPVHPNRLRQRQYYLPTTNFAEFGYDDMSPEEQVLKAQWMTKMRDFRIEIPAFSLMLTAMVTLRLSYAPRFLAMVAMGFTGVYAEVIRMYMNAMPEREQLDDFITAKEMWYIKNVEARELGLSYPKSRDELDAAQQRFAYSEAMDANLDEAPAQMGSLPTEGKGTSMLASKQQ